MADWIPNYIRKNINYQAHEILTAKEFNALLNLLITQGDYNSAWLEYLQTEGIPDAIAQLSIDEIREALTQAVAEELAALAASVVNKTSAHLNTPVFSFVDLSMQTDMADFRTVLEAHNITGDFCVATNLIGQSAAYPSLLTLQAMEVAGHEIVSLGTDGASLDRLTASEVATVANNAKQYMQTYFANADVFVYPGGTESTDVQTGVSQVYTYAVNIAQDAAAIDSENIRFNNLRLQLPVVHITSTNNIETAAVKAIIDDVIANNKYCIITVDTSATAYSAEAIGAVIEYIQSHAGITYANLSHAVELCETTINNQLRELFQRMVQEAAERVNWEQLMREEYEQFKTDFAHELKVDVLQNCYVDYEDEQGTLQEEKYLHW